MRSEPNGRSGRPQTAARTATVSSEALAGIRRLERAFGECDWTDRRALALGRKRAKARSLEAIEWANPDAGWAPVLAAAAELFGAMRVELAASPEKARALIDEVEEVVGIPRLALAREVLRAPELLLLPPAAAVDAQLGMLVALASLRSASLWALDEAEQVTCMRHAGDSAPSRSAREVARDVLLSGVREDAESSRRALLGVAVGRWQQPLAALVGSARPGMRDAAAAFLAEALPIFGAILEREALLGANAESERALVQTSERKLTRLGYDLHDGPIQDVAILADDLRLFRRQLQASAGEAPDRKILGGRLDDLDAQLAALDTGLRQIANEVHGASVVMDRPFAAAIRDVAKTFAARTQLEPELMLEGDLSTISVSQQIALLNIVHEALNNIREHSDATTVQIAVSANSQGVEAQVSDDGRGFDLESTLLRAARKGRLGLVAMHERVRLLGGRCRIDSRLGGPTVVSVALDRWEPLVQDCADRDD